MSDWTDNQDPYQVLGLTQGHETTEAELKKVAFPANSAYTVCLVTNDRAVTQAYRALVLKKHPDKQKSNPNAAAEFHLIQKAYELLSDGKARAALDDLYK